LEQGANRPVNLGRLCRVLTDVRLWLLIALSVAMLYTIEAIENFVEGSWPQLKRPFDFWDHFGEVRHLWAAVAMLVLPGLVLTILNIAMLLLQDLPHSNIQVLGTIFVIIGWLIFLLTAIDFLGIGTYLRMVGFIVPVALLLVLFIGDLLLVIALIDVFPDDLSSFLPFADGDEANGETV
jgi:hypothetical protein